ncbi:MAG: tetratricopeptide repeat protein [Gemmatimonadales bacterium]|nr:tetratricopeptide repeat protein [Gemmatimonadales bacterium]NIN10062.1 tetratricopeptide repeat protein [Gemmatimonadales bacterium]NIQ98713.1 tetratricopeptide repeat protein [Gemmatimonadales bacterium]NIS63591.1 tetratricopeptide repeat protein [Gemmatimonadales bacterium]
MCKSEYVLSRSRLLLLSLVLAVVPLLSACAGARPTEVSPEEIPELEQRIAEQPGNADVILRYAAALYAAERCDSARAVALTGMAIRPESAIGPLVMGQCFEREEEYDQAIAVYRQFLAEYPDRRGSPAVRAREMFALRARASMRARAALDREAELARQPADPQTLAVLPLEIAGDTSFLPLSRGLAQILTSDLALLQRFRLVERLQLGALIQEMQLAEAGRVDVATAARMGRLLQAGRMVQGLAAIPPEGDVRLEAAVVRSDGQVTSPEVATGRLRDLLRLEKDVVIGIAAQLGYVLSEAERQMILENGTQDLAAFLAYSRGLLAEDLGDYAAAAAHFADAIQRDPGFADARDEFEVSAVAQEVQEATPGEVTTVAAEAPPPPPIPVTQPVVDALSSTVQDVASTQGEQAAGTTEQQQTTQPATGTTAADPPPPTTPPPSVTGKIRIFFRLP